MAPRKPKVGEPAIIDGAEYEVMSVPSSDSVVVKLGDPDAVARAGRVAEIREAAAPKEADFAKRNEEAKALENATQRRAELAAIAVEEVPFRTALGEELEAVPRGTTVSVHATDLVYLESASVIVDFDASFVEKAYSGIWSIPGRLHPFAVKGQRVPSDLRRQVSFAAAHRAAKG